MLTKDIRPMTREYFTVGPFVVTYHRGDKGMHFIGNIQEPMNRNEAFYRGILLKGHMKCVHAPKGAELTPDYFPGTISEDRPPFTHAGRYVQECTEDDTVFMCLQRRNRLEWHKSFSHKWLRDFPAFADSSTSFVLNRYRVLALGTGSIKVEGQIKNGPFVLWTMTRAVEVEIITPVRGIVVWVPREDGDG